MERRLYGNLTKPSISRLNVGLYMLSHIWRQKNVNCEEVERHEDRSPGLSSLAAKQLIANRIQATDDITCLSRTIASS